MDPSSTASATLDRATPARSRPKVLLLVTLAEVGGAQTYVAELVPGLVGEFDAVVAAHGEGPLVEAARSAGARYVPLEHVRRPIAPLRDLRGLLELIRLFRRERPAIVHANSSKAGALGRLAALAARVPVRVFTVHGWAFATTAGPMARAYLVLERLLRRVTTLVVCVSHVDRELGLRARTCDAERSTVIWNAVDVSAAPRSNCSGEPPRIVSVGRLQGPQKDFSTLLEAVSLVGPRPFEVLVVGDGPDRQALERRRAALGLDGRVQLLGARDDVPELLASSDLFVLATTYESLPISIIEAMAAGLPVVASDVGGVPELVVDGENGLLVPPKDPRALASAIARLLDDASLRRRMGEASRRRAEAHFDLPGFREAHAAAYRRLLRDQVSSVARLRATEEA